MTTRFALIAAALATTAVALAGPAHAASAVHGDAEAGARNWSQQTYDDCGVMAIDHLIGFFTGNTASEEDIIAEAGTLPSLEHDGPVYVKPADLDNPNTGDGIAQIDMPVLAQHYGVNAVYTDDESAEDSGWATGMQALEDYLDASGAVVAIADADIIWKVPGAGYGPHAVMVTEVDTVNGVVHMNDSGPDDGADEQVSIDDFEAAWGMDGHQLVVATT